MRPRLPLAVRVATAAFDAFTRALPAGFRSTFADEIRESFRDEAEEAYRLRGRVALVRVTLHGLRDVTISSLATRAPRQGPSRRAARQFPRRRGSFMHATLLDLRYALRLFRRQPGFAAVAIATLAVGIGGNTAIFSLVDSAFLRQLPYGEADRLVRIWGEHALSGDTRSNVNPVDAEDWQRDVTAFESVGLWTLSSQTISGVGDPVVVPAAFMTSGFFPTLGVSAAAGRLPGREHDRPGRETEVVVTHGFWRSVLGGDPAVIGRTIHIGEIPCTIIGVLPQGFVSPGIRSGAEPQIWRPYAVGPDTGRGGHFMSAIAKLNPGASREVAQSQLSVVTDRLAREFPSTNKGQGAGLEPLRDAIVGDARTALLVLMGAVGVVLLIACANVANLLLARAAARQREIAVRGAMGASRARVVRQLMTESLLLGLLAGAAGAGLAWLAVRAIPRFIADQLPLVMATRIDMRVLTFAVVLSMGTAVIFGLIPALQAARADLRSTLVALGRSTGPRRLQSVLLVVEHGLAVVLLVAAALLVESFLKLHRVDPGFDAEHVLTFRVNLPRARYDTADRRRAFFTEAIARVEGLPGVTAAGSVNMAPLGNRYSCDSFGLADRPAPPDGDEPCAESRIASSDYFRAIGIGLDEGRVFEPTDTAAAEPVLVISQAMAQKYWPDTSAVGRRFKWGSATAEGPWRRIVGVVGNVRHYGLDADAPPEVYMPLEQVAASSMTFAVRTTRDPKALTGEIRGVMASIDEALAIAEVLTTRELIDRSTALPRFRTGLIAVFAAVALGLALIGVYGVMAFFVAERTSEIGIRVALGASPFAVRHLVIRRGMGAAALGTILGLGASSLVVPLLAGLLFSVEAMNPVAFTVPPVVLLLTAFIATSVAARRATRVDPLVAMRTE